MRMVDAKGKLVGLLEDHNMKPCPSDTESGVCVRKCSPVSSCKGKCFCNKPVLITITNPVIIIITLWQSRPHAPPLGPTDRIWGKVVLSQLSQRLPTRFWSPLVLGPFVWTRYPKKVTVATPSIILKCLWFRYSIKKKTTSRSLVTLTHFSYLVHP